MRAKSSIPGARTVILINLDRNRGVRVGQILLVLEQTCNGLLRLRVVTAACVEILTDACKDGRIHGIGTIRVQLIHQLCNHSIIIAGCQEQ